MKFFLVFIYSILFFAYGNALENKNIDSVSDQEIEDLLDYSNIEIHSHIRPTINIFRPAENKELIYIAVEHVTDLLHPTIKKIKAIIESGKIDFGIFEGFNPSYGISPEWISFLAEQHLQNNACPENIYSGYLCAQNNIPFVGGDAPNHTFLEPLAKKGFLEKDVIFFMLALNFPFWNRDGLVNKANFKELCENMMQVHIAHWLCKEKISYTVDEFLEWHEAHIGKALDIVKDFPWGVEQKEFMPSTARDATIYQQIQAHILAIRDMHCLKVIQDSLKKYNRVFVVFGASHLIWQKNALEKLFKCPVKQELII